MTSELAPPDTAYKRIQRGWSHDDAWLCPPKVPLWLYRAERELGEPLHEYLRREASRAKDTGESLSSIAASFGVPKWRIHHYSTQHGIKWPLYVSRYQREAATQNIEGFNNQRGKQK